MQLVIEESMYGASTSPGLTLQRPWLKSRSRKSPQIHVLLAESSARRPVWETDQKFESYAQNSIKNALRLVAVEPQMEKLHRWLVPRMVQGAVTLSPPR